MMRTTTKQQHNDLELELKKPREEVEVEVEVGIEGEYQDQIITSLYLFIHLF